MAKTGYQRKKNQALLDLIAENILYYRNLKGISRETLAGNANVESKSIYNYENALSDISASSIASIAEGLEIEAYKLLMPTDKNQ